MSTTTAPKRAVKKSETPERSWSHLRLPKEILDQHPESLLHKDVPPPLKPIRVTPDLVQLKKFKEHRELSEETIAYSAEVWFKGRYVAHASNNGHGGDDDIHPVDRGLYKEFEEWVNSLPLGSEFNQVYEAMDRLDMEELKGLTADMNDPEKTPWWRTCFGGFERFMSSLVAHHMLLKDRSLSKQCYMFDKNTKEFSVSVFKAAITPDLLERIRARYGEAVAVKDFIEGKGFNLYPAPHSYRRDGYHEVLVYKGDTVVRPTEVTDTHVRIVVLGTLEDMGVSKDKKGYFYKESIKFDRDAEKEVIKLTPDDAIAQLVKAEYRYKG